MTKPDNMIKLLLIEDSVEEAEQIISVLRNGGIAVRPARASNEAELEAALEQQVPDVIIANLDCADLALAHVNEAAARGGRTSRSSRPDAARARTASSPRSTTARAALRCATAPSTCR